MRKQNKGKATAICTRHILPSRYKTKGTEGTRTKKAPRSFPQSYFPSNTNLSGLLLPSFLGSCLAACCFFQPLSSFPKSLSLSLRCGILQPRREVSKRKAQRLAWISSREVMFHGGRPLSLRGSLKALEADIHHANTLAHAIHRAYGGTCVQMRLSYSSMAPIILNLIQWMDCSCSLSYTLPSYLGLLEVLVYKVYVDGDASISTIERRASLKEFYAIIYPFLQQIEENVMEKECKGKGWCKGDGDSGGRKLYADDKDAEREDECGICLETCTKMVLPNCNHAMCINCYRDWYTRSKSCPFCRGSLKRVRSTDLWVLTRDEDVIDTVALEKENVRHFHSFIDSLPLIVPDNLLLVYYDYLV